MNYIIYQGLSQGRQTALLAPPPLKKNPVYVHLYTGKFLFYMYACRDHLMRGENRSCITSTPTVVEWVELVVVEWAEIMAQINMIRVH